VVTGEVMASLTRKRWRGTSTFLRERHRSGRDRGLLSRRSWRVSGGVYDHEAERVLIWRALGLTPDDAASYKDSGLKISRVAVTLPVEAPDLLDRQPPRSYEDEAHEWSKAGFTPAIAKRWVELRFSLRAAEAWSRNGVAQGEAASWRERIASDELN